MSTVKRTKTALSPAQQLAAQDETDAETGIGKRLGLVFREATSGNEWVEGWREKKAKRTHKPVHSVETLENLATMLSTRSGEMMYFDRPPPMATTLQPAIYAMWAASISEPFGWMVFWARYVDNRMAQAHFLSWAEREISRSGADSEHTRDLTELLGRVYFEGNHLSGRRISKMLKIRKDFKTTRYLETIQHILNAAYASENELGRQVRKMRK